MIGQIYLILPFFNFIALGGTALIFLFPITNHKNIISRYLVVVSIFILTGWLSIFFNFSLFLNSTLSYVIVFFAVLFCAEINWKEIFFHSFWTVLVSKLFMVIYTLIGYISDSHLTFPYWLQLFLISAYIFTFNFIMGKTVAKSLLLHHTYHIGPRQFSSALLLTVIFELLNYFLFTTYFAEMNLLSAALIIMGEFYCVTVLYLQNALFSQSAIQQELDKHNYLWEHQKNQYNLSKENISLINRKCHDLRHQISAIRNMSTASEQNMFLMEVEDSINIYDSIVQTGNEALDIILTEKSLFCQSHNININCVADGARLNFMSPVDLYTIFGNAVDNAIESVMDCEELDNRLIDVMIYKKNELLIINIINPLEKTLEFQSDLPKSTKTANGYHGFGLKSIRHTVEKYSGFMTIDTNNRSFSLSIVIPTRKNKI